MKLLIASDLHGSAYYCRALLDAFRRERADRMVLLGDLLYHGPRNELPEEYDTKAVTALLNDAADKLLCVRGNCDAEVDQMVLEFPVMAEYTTLALENGKLLFATHGHHFDPEHLPPIPAGSAFAFGHVHVKHLEWKDGILILNPGSVSIPKDGTHSYMTYEGGCFVQKLLDGTPLASMEF